MPPMFFLRRTLASCSASIPFSLVFSSLFGSLPNRDGGCDGRFLVAHWKEREWCDWHCENNLRTTHFELTCSSTFSLSTQFLTAISFGLSNRPAMIWPASFSLVIWRMAAMSGSSSKMLEVPSCLFSRAIARAMITSIYNRTTKREINYRVNNVFQI